MIVPSLAVSTALKKFRQARTSVTENDALAMAGVKVSGYKCFERAEGFDYIRPFNLIIGRNNAGKSALLDLLAHAVKPSRTEPLQIETKTAQVFITDAIHESDRQRLSERFPYFGQITGHRITWCGQADGRQLFVSVDAPLGSLGSPEGLFETMLNNKANPFQGFVFKRLAAERDIQPEAAGEPNIQQNQNGIGATRTIHHFRSNVKRDNTVIENRLLNDLNTIFASDAHFTKIDTRESGGAWEIYLDEAEKGRIPLSRSGSALKTVILVLIYLHLIPRIENVAPSKYLYGFEELENNLHPSLQRRLLHFLREHAIESGCRFFLTTHSPVEIDYFARDEKAQVLHVTHDGKNATVTTLSSYSQGRRLLDDLDLRASDILQSNGIIWVEGPSDRIYLNKWIELWASGKYREGAHYQVLFYGGKLLKHLDAQDPDVVAETIHILTTNRNAAIIIDSDKLTAEGEINSTKQRVKDEITSSNGFAWVTAGREIENYIPSSLLRSIVKLTDELGTFGDITQAVIGDKKIPRRFADKVTLAQEITPHLTREHIAGTDDLARQLTVLIETIKRWNGD
jgi:putative ATP-dependent endonuclease of OLD family